MLFHRPFFGLLIIVFISAFFINFQFYDVVAEELDVTKIKQSSSTDSDVHPSDEAASEIEGIPLEELKKLRDGAKKDEFEADVSKMMNIIINSLYKNKEIFLRELISNAADALDKIRILSLTDKSALSATDDLVIRLKADKEKHTLSIQDTGIGMTVDELSTNLGTIAKSGTAEFFSSLSATGATNATNELIGQFGVGFYSAFLVSDHVTVISKSNADDQYIWESDTKYFSVIKDPRGDTLLRGTEIILHLKDEAADYLDSENLKNVVKKYSQFINFPIYIWGSQTITEPVPSKEDKSKDANDDVTVEDVSTEDKKPVERTVWDWIRINENKPIWSRNPADVTEEEYISFFKAFSGQMSEPLAKIHFTAEGDTLFKALLYLPNKARHDLFKTDKPVHDNIKLYVRKVFITDNSAEILPRYLAFIYGIVDSDDLPLNVSRETLQTSKLLILIKKKIVRKVLEMISKLSKEDYEVFWKEYAVAIKLGVMHDGSNKARLVKLLRYKTSEFEKELQSFENYVSRMKEKQDKIYFVTSSSLTEAKTSIFVERIIKKGYEVIYMTEPIDEYVMQHLPDFDGKSFINVAKEEFALNEGEKAKKIMEAQNIEFKVMLDWLENNALSGKIEKAVLSQRLESSPCALVAKQYGWTGNLDRVMRAQAYGSDDASTNYYMNQNKILEVNARHPVIKELKRRVSIDSADAEAKETALLLFDIATIRSGYSISDASQFADRIDIVMRKNLQISSDESVEADHEELPDSETPSTEFETETADENQEKDSTVKIEKSEAQTEFQEQTLHRDEL